MYNLKEKKLNSSLGRKRILPVEISAVHQFANNFMFVTFMCQTTYVKELNNPGSSNIHFLDDIYSEEPLPTKETDVFTLKHLKEYVVREIFHTCVWDKEIFGPLSFIHDVIMYLKYQFENKKLFLDPSTTLKIQQFFDKCCLDEYTASKSIFEHVDTYLKISQRWYQMIKAYKIIEQSNNLIDPDTNIKFVDFTGFDSYKKAHSSYQTSCSHHHAQIRKTHESLKVRFHTWWLTVMEHIEDELLMEHTFSKSLSHVFGFKYIFFQPGFHFNYSSNTSGLARNILNHLDESADSTLDTLTDKFNTFLNTFYASADIESSETWLNRENIKSVRICDLYNVVTERFNTKRNKVSAEEYYTKISNDAKIELTAKMDLLKDDIVAETTYCAWCDISDNSVKDVQENTMELQCTVDCSQTSHTFEKVESLAASSFHIPPDTLCDRAGCAIEFLDQEKNGELFNHLQYVMNLNESMIPDYPSTLLPPVQDVSSSSIGLQKLQSIFEDLKNKPQGLLYTKLFTDDSDDPKS